MGYKMKVVGNFGRTQSQKLGIAVLVGFFLFSLTILAMSKTYMFPFPNLSFGLSMRAVPTSPRAEDSTGSRLSDARNEDPKMERKQVCDYSGPRSVLCEMEGDVRIHGKSSTIVLVTNSQTSTSEINESLWIKPYARKGDMIALRTVKEVSLKSWNGRDGAPRCTVNHTAQAIVFSTGGYAGNLFHDFSDMLIPLFLTSIGFRREVQFLVTDMKPSWVNKNRQVLNRLSRYEIIDLDNDDAVHCFPRVFVGLRCHKEFNIDPTRSPIGYSMANFTQFIRSSYSLERETVTDIGQHRHTKPRLLIISRKWTRSFTNIDQIVRMAEELGYEVVVAEVNSKTDVAEFARVVNSCDVMMGIHGAGLSNLVFLPTNATLIQIVPWGRLEWIARYDFGWPAADAKLRYLQYEVSVEESSLMEQYPRDHPIIMDPLSVHKQGWNAVRTAFLVKQNVRLDVTRFRSVLLEAIKASPSIAAQKPN